MVKIAAKFFFICFLTGFCGACSLKTGPDTLITLTGGKKEIYRVAVLPFTNETKRPEASMMVYRIFLNELIASALFDVKGEGEVRLFLFRNRVLPGDLMDVHLYADFSRQLEIDAVIKGKVVDFGTKEIGPKEMIPYLSLQVEMINAETGRTMLTTFHRRTGDAYRMVMHFGIIKNMSTLVVRVVQEILDDWKREGIAG
jgi:hypothetical protein